MKTTARILTALLGLIFLFNGIRFGFFPESVISLAAITPVDGFGMANIRANIGASLLTLSLLLWYSAIRAKSEGVLVFLVFMMLYVLTRLTGLAIDEFHEFSLRASMLASTLLVVTFVAYV